MGFDDKWYGCSLCSALPRLCRQTVAPFLGLPPADGADPAISAPVLPGATLGGAGEPLDGGQLTGQALAVEAGAGGGGVTQSSAREGPSEKIPVRLPLDKLFLAYAFPAIVCDLISSICLGFQKPSDYINVGDG